MSDYRIFYQLQLFLFIFFSFLNVSYGFLQLTARNALTTPNVYMTPVARSRWLVADTDEVSPPPPVMTMDR